MSGLVRALLVGTLLGAFDGELLATDLLQINDHGGWQIYPGGGYRYGPSIIINDDASIDMWLSAPGENGAWDCIKYRRSSDGGHTWTPDVDALTPTPGSRDAYSTCDPGVIRFGGYYYVGYTSTEDRRGTDNHVYVARSTDPAGPYEKWNGTSWGGKPQPMLTYTGNHDTYGYGEPSFVIQAGLLYVFFTDNDGGNYTDLAVCADPSVDDWPAFLSLKGHVIDRPGEDSADIKYVDDMSRFVAVATHNRFTPNATVDVWQSFDGLSWQRAPFRGAQVQCGAHNIGISGTETGHIDGAYHSFIAYSYQPSGFYGGNWPTYVDLVALSRASPGQVVNVEVSSLPQGATWNWNGPRLSDDDLTTCWSSNSRGHTNRATEWASVDLGETQTVTGVRVAPREGGICFPVDFKWQFSKDASTWTDVRGESFADYPNPGRKEALFQFEPPVEARYLRLVATRLSADELGDNYLQLAEIVPEVAEASPSDSLSLTTR